MRLIAICLMFGLGASYATAEGPQPSSGTQHAGDPQDWPAYEGCIAAGYSPIEWPAGSGQWICPCPDHTNEVPHFLVINENSSDPEEYRTIVLSFCNPAPDEDEDPGSTTD